MSRTYRSGHYIESDPTYEEWRYDSHRDKKKAYKPNSKFKKSKSRSRKAKVKDSMRKDNEIPKFRKTDVWDWN